MIKRIKKWHIALVSVFLVLISSGICFFTYYQKPDNHKENIIRTIEVGNNIIDCQNIFNSFEEPKLEVVENITTFEGIKTFNLKDFDELDLVSDGDIDQAVEMKVKYSYFYDSETNIITLTAKLVDEEGTEIIDTMMGVAFVNDEGNLDAVFDCDGECILLSEIQDLEQIQNCGWFKKALKKVAKAVKKVCKTTVGVVGTVLTVAVPAVVGVVCAVASAPVVATVAIGAVVGAGIAATTAAASTYIQDGKVDWETVGIYAGVGTAVGALASGVSYGITKILLSNGRISKDIDLNKIGEHIFSNDHINNGILELGESKEDILIKFFDIVNSTYSQWVEGANEIHTIINGKETTIRFFIKDGQIINLDGFVGISSRIIGHLIDLIH